MIDIQNDIKVWKEFREVENIFKELGFELLQDKSLQEDMIKEHLSSIENICAFYLEHFYSIFEQSSFYVKDFKNSLYGYINDNVITYLGGDFFLIQKGMSLSEALLIEHFFKEKKQYKYIQKRLNQYGLNIRKYKEVKKIFKKNFSDSMRLEEELGEAEDLCKYGRKLKAKEWKISKKEFLEWRSPRFGEDNPTKISSKVWEYAVYSRDGAYWINDKFKGPSSCSAGPAWCFNRFGKSLTFMPDGREIHIAGEHEDYYDPDFYIYNDVIVVYPDDTIEFYNYPKEVFPPTDFHSATLVGETIVMIGSLGYDQERQIGKTQILLLDTKSFKVEKIEPSGLQPGWIHKHKAILSEDKKSIKIIGGEIDLGSDKSLMENIDEWELDLESWTWKQLTKKCWRQFEFKRRDNNFNKLFNIRSALFSYEANWDEKYKNDMKELTNELGFKPDVTLIKELYLPNIKHKVISLDEPYIVSIDGVKVRFDEDMHTIKMTVEGKLKDKYIEEIKNSVLSKLQKLEGVDYIFKEIARD